MDRQPVILLEQAGRSDPAVTREAWQRFIAGGDADALVRPHVVEAWRRSVAGGCDPRLMKADTLGAAETEALLESEEPIITASRPYLDALSRAAPAEPHAVMLGNGAGRVLDVVGDPRSVRGPEAVPGPGALLDEASAGANGLGTPLAEARYVELVGPEHFIEGFHVFTCQGIPLRDPDGDVAGVLGISVRRIATADRLRDILFCAAHGIECELIARELSGAVASLSSLGDGDVSERLRQDLVQRLAAARLWFESAALRAGDAGAPPVALLAHGEALIERFRRLSVVWRDLVGDAVRAPVPLSLGGVVSDVIELLETEARLADIRFDWDPPGGTTVIEDRQAVARGVLNVLLTAMQQAGRGARIIIEVEHDEAQNGPPRIVTSTGAMFALPASSAGGE